MEFRKFILYKREYDNIVKLRDIPYFDFYPDPNLCRMEVVNFKKYLIMPKIEGKTLSEIMNEYRYIDKNGKFKYSKVEFDLWENLIITLLELMFKVNDFNKYYYHNDLNLSNIIYDGKMMHVIDFETMKSEPVLIDDITALENICYELIDFGCNNPEIKEFCEKNKFIGNFETILNYYYPEI